MSRSTRLRYANVLLLFGFFLSFGSMAFGQTVPEAGGAATEANSAEQPAEQPNSLDALLDMADKDVSQLSQVRVAGLTGSPSLDIPVTTVSRQESTVGRSPAAVFVVTNEMIRRSGAKEIPEVLRMVPGLEVAKIDSSTWAVTARGSNGRFANALLVQIDGRTVYTPLFAGVFWDVQDVLLEDVERIEVIRGPGGTLWGANAVNGVINIITKSAKDTQGAYVETGTGTYEQGYASARYGGRAGKDLAYRIYGKWFERDTGYLPDAPVEDAWRQARGGFRMDWDASPDDTITLQGEYYNGYSGDRSVFPIFQGGQIHAVPPYYSFRDGTTYVNGENINMNWKRELGEKSDWTLRTYYDRTSRVWQKYDFSNDCTIFDVDFQHRFPMGTRHAVIWGLGFRNTRDAVATATPAITLNPTERTDKVYSCFLQDEITLSEDLWYLTIGSKLEHNDYTGIELEPSIRLLWTPDNKRSVWGAISRAVRTPSHGETAALDTRPPTPPSPPYIPLPVYPVVYGNPNMQSEELIAYELGYREQTTKRFSWDLTGFINSYERLIGPVLRTPYPVYVANPYVVQPIYLDNVQAGCVYGAELTATWQIRPAWQLRGAYTYLFMDLHTLNNEKADINRQNPNNQLYLQSGWDLGNRWELDLIARYVDHLPSFGVPSYIVGDVRLAWHCREHLEFSVVGRNLLKGPHAEFGDDQNLGTLHTLVEPEVYGQLVWRR